MSTPDRHLRVLFAAWVLCFLVAAVGGLSTAEAVREWYPTLDKPPWTPPNAAFGPIWTFLYITMAIGFWDAWRRSADGRAVAGAFLLQLALNAAWSPVFFGAHLVGPGLLVISALWFAVLACIVVFRRTSRLGAWLYVPYLIWITIASSINAWVFLFDGG